MAKWVILMTVVVVIAGIAVMVLWTSVNQILSGHGTEVQWASTAVAALVLILAAAIFVNFTNRLALSDRHEEKRIA
jgi:hypothetical protein